MIFRRASLAKEITDLETRIERLENVLKHHQFVMDRIGKYVESDIASPWLPSAQRLVEVIKSIPKI